VAADLLGLFSGTVAAQRLRRWLEGSGRSLRAALDRAAAPFLAAWIKRAFPRRVLLVVTDGPKAQEQFHQDASTWLAHTAPRHEPAGEKPPAAAPSSAVLSPPLYFPEWEILPGEGRLPHADIIAERLETLLALGEPAAGLAPLVVTDGAALMQRTFAPADLRGRRRRLEPGDRVSPLELVDWLEAQGYELEAQASQKGTFALRGGILDLFPPTCVWPVRIEFFGDEIESMRWVDPHSQISRETAARVTIPPAGELGLLRRELDPSNRGDDAAFASAPAPAPFASLLDYLPKDAIVLVPDVAAVEAHALGYFQQGTAADPLLRSWSETRSGLGCFQILEALAPEPVLGPLADAPADQSPIEPRPPEPAALDLPFGNLDLVRPFEERSADPVVAEAQRREFFSQLHRWLRQGSAVHVFCNNDGERERFTEIWREYGFDANAAPVAQPLAAEIGALARGFTCEAARFVVVTDAEVFARYKVQRPRRLKSPHAQAARSLLDIDFTDLESGDLVVHLNHGIGRYLGLQMLPARTGAPAGARFGEGPPPQEECLVLEFAPASPDQPAPKLYVRVTEAHLVSKYVGAGKALPPLNKLGGTRWTRAKAQAQAAVRDLASDLLATQAARAAQPGHAFGADTPWQREFEGAFLYEETPDQWRAIQAAKQDMEIPKPMDRLICGDVGYGKTEVALRAAFKAVMGGKQVAVLVPTTVLAQQHYNTFRERTADYPIRIELLSRFRSRLEQVAVARDLAAGTIDIVIGTHRLLQPDIVFKDLGLVVIDEEQRFGVVQKERFKRLRRLIDVLTLTATPIPRTLYLALTGARDMSTIETPPQDRLPVETVVAQYDERLVREAIQRELNRQGQVFFLHNRVTTIEAVATRLRALVPQARLVVGHGQMHADALEEVMTTFVNGAADILLSTTIIESGLDIPNANTIIIDRADRFGLSELYQLRGRVGRYKHQAFAYLLLPRHARLVANVRKRLSAIKQYSSLGSGFRIAMRDLEIRGAGNLLGTQQSGHITAVGFELYCQLLEHSVRALKGEPVQPRVEVQMRLDFVVFNPTPDPASESPAAPAPSPARRGGRAVAAPIAVPREAAVWHADEGAAASATLEAPAPAPRAPASACLPLGYVRDTRHRIELYRKLAQALTPEALANLRTEIEDRFGPLPEAVELLLRVAELKLLAARCGVVEIGNQGPKLMFMRGGDYVAPGGKFPRLARATARGRLQEIKRLLLALGAGSQPA
jgi:transcription-repair coupling factor (superfamily II helicase)